VGSEMCIRDRLVTGSNLWRDLLTLEKRGQAMEQARRVIKLNPDSWVAHYLLSAIQLTDSKLEDSISEAEKVCALEKGDLVLKSWLGVVYGLGGHKEQAENILNELKEAEKNRYVPGWWVAVVLFSLERSDEAFRYLDEDFEERSTGLFYFRNFPWFRKFRTDPRWASLEERIGLWKK